MIECGAGHSIPGIAGADGVGGPLLEKFRERKPIGGVGPNEPAMLMRWVRDAPSIAPHTGMPGLPLTDEAARDIAAYLHTLR